MADIRKLQSLSAGTELLLGGDRLIRVPDDIAARFQAGDSLCVVEATEEVLLIPAAQQAIARDAVARATQAFTALGSASDAAISGFFEAFAQRLEDPEIWARVEETNRRDVADARARGRSTTRLVADAKMRSGMVAGLRGWIGAPSRRGQVIERIEHEGWQAELVGAALGVVAFVFEGRPNVLADATGVLRGGNAVVFRIGRDALATAACIMEQALIPALVEVGLPRDAVVLVESPEHAAGWALFSDSRLSLAVARGSGPAVATLGAIAQQAGTPVSLHGTGGAWIVASERKVRPPALYEAIVDSLDRKVCNTLNTLCIPEPQAAELIPIALAALEEAGQRLGQSYKLHVVEASRSHVPAELFEQSVEVMRAEGVVREPLAEPLAESELGLEWEWEQTPEVTLHVVEDLAHAVALFNRHSPHFVASLVSDDPDEHARFYDSVDAPFVGDGQTRWVDGQKALSKPELGLSNWQSGRLFGRGAILSGDSVFTVRTRARKT
ncbi:MAG: hypothetical protein OEZ06_00420 [Myxococcales bacterium]|nr:hypothetical protein [Myxococcales bacterium]